MGVIMPVGYPDLFEFERTIMVRCVTRS